MRILVTGAAGAIGRVVVPALVEAGHRVSGLDRAPRPAGLDAVAWTTGECTDPAVVAAAFASFSGSPEEAPEAVLHLAGHPDEAGLADSLASHVHTTGVLLDACVAAGTRRFVYASSNHAVGRTPHEGTVGVDARPRPDTFYGVGKVAAEALMSLYADRYAIDAVACRIGSFGQRPRSRRQLATWLSPEDCVRMVAAALEAPAPGFAVLYGISANTRAWWDLEPGRALGYEPRDDAEEFAADVPSGPDDVFEDSLVGGPFAGGAYVRSAF